MHFKIFGLHIVVISNYDTASSLMSQASYSDRPILTMVGKLCVLFARSLLDPSPPVVEHRDDDRL
jgi:hypothetical protein